MKKLLLLAIATIMSLGASAQLITSNTVTYKKSSGYNRIGVSYNSISSNAEGSDYFGYSVAISANTIVVGAKAEASNQTTITNGTTSSADNTAAGAGAAAGERSSRMPARCIACARRS